MVRRTGLLPAAGKGHRLDPYRGHKELYPLLCADGHPSPLYSFALRALHAAGVRDTLMTISADRGETLRHCADGADFGMQLNYIVQREVRGLPDVIRLGAHWLSDSRVFFTMPDTLLFPTDALLQLDSALDNADIVLGVFPTNRPHELAPVHIESGQVVKIQDKPVHPIANNTWGCLAWQPTFTDYCARWAQARLDDDKAELNLSAAMESARLEGFRVHAVEFPDGRFIDAGTRAGLLDAQHTLFTQPCNCMLPIDFETDLT